MVQRVYGSFSAKYPKYEMEQRFRTRYVLFFSTACLRACGLKPIWNPMQTCTLTATKSRLIYLLPTEGSSSRTRSAYEKYLFASQMSNYAVKHGAQVLPLTFQYSYTGALTCFSHKATLSHLDYITHNTSQHTIFFSDTLLYLLHVWMRSKLFSRRRSSCHACKRE